MLSVGTYGKIRYQRVPVQGPLVSWRARTQVRDEDGRVRPVERSARTKSLAETRLKEALRDRVYTAPLTDVITVATKVEKLAEVYFSEGKWAASSAQEYRRVLDKHVIPDLGGLEVRNLTVGRCDTFLKKVSAVHGPSTAKMVRGVLSGMARLACRHEALRHNPLREVRKDAPEKKPAKVFTLAEARQIRALITYDDKAVRRDLPDLIDFMLATSLRIGEAIAFDWGDINLDAGTCDVTANVHRITGTGLVRNPYPNNKLKHRTLALPKWAVEILRARRDARGAMGLVFPSTGTGSLRDPNNTLADLREAFKVMGIDGATSHMFRKTGATLLDAAGGTPRMVADQLGQEHVQIGQGTYIKRDATKSGAAKALEPLAF